MTATGTLEEIKEIAIKPIKGKKKCQSTWNGVDSDSLSLSPSPPFLSLSHQTSTTKGHLDIGEISFQRANTAPSKVLRDDIDKLKELRMHQLCKLLLAVQ